MIYPTTLSSALRTSPNLSSPLYRRWFPGQGQRGGGFAGMGLCDPSDPTCVSVDTTTLDIGGGYAGAPTGIVTSTDPTPSMYSQLIAQGVAPADAYQYDPTGAIAAGVDPSTLYAAPGSTIQNVTPGTALTPAQLTAQQVAAPLTAGTVSQVATTVCPSGYRSSTGACVAATGQWFSFATNAQVMTYGAVILGALILVPMISGGGGRRRR
jgi:hypothetical protein